MEMSPAAKVGMIAVVALLLFGLVLTQIGGLARERGSEYIVSFQNVGGLTVKAPVLLAGVKVGTVKSMDLNPDDQRVRVTLQVTREGVNLYRNRRPDDPSGSFYVYTVAGNLLGDKWLDIRTGRIPADTPTLKPQEDVILGEPPVSLDDLAREGNAVMGEFRRSVTALNDLVADRKFQSDIRETMGNFNQISTNMKGASSDARALVATLNARMNRLSDAVQGVMGHVDQTVLAFQSDAAVVGADMRSFSSGLRGAVSRNQGNIDQVVSTLRQTAVSLRNTMTSLEKLSANKDIREDVVAAVHNLKRTSEELQGVASDIRSVTADPEVQSDLRDTMENAKDASENAKGLLNRVKRFGDGVSNGGLANLYLDNEWSTKSGRPAFNANAYLLPNAAFGAKVGVDSIGIDNLVNFQVFKNFGDVRIRAGAVRSELGGGADVNLFAKRLMLSLDAYDTHKFQLDLTGKVFLPADFYLLGGYRNVTQGSGYPIIGAGKRF